MADEEHTGTCILQCGRNPHPDLVPVCGPCRSRVRNHVREIDEWHAELAAEAGPDATRTERWHVVEEFDHLIEVDGERVVAVVRTERLFEVDITAGRVPGQSNQPRVRGSREAPMPIRADVVDLLAEVDERTVHDRHTVPMIQATGDKQRVTALFGGKEVHQEIRLREVVRDEKHFRCRCANPDLHADQPARPVLVPAADQVGEVSAATILDGWCRDFAESRRESTPQPEVADQCRYLLDRLDWAFTDHPAVDEFALEVGDLWHALRRATGRTEPQPEVCWGIQCRDEGCSYVNTLERLAGSEWIECSECGLLLSEDEYAAWCKLLAAAERKTA